ncbi:MAG TPA: type I methionyl aminopeptidase [bacterium]|nr:type I methionyl aminopeptidase [bacterium]
MIPLKTPSQINIMRQGGQILARILNMALNYAKAGVGTKELDSLVEKEIRAAGGWPAFKGYQGFPSSICTCLTTEIVHAPATPNRILKEGDLLTIDLGMRYPAKNGLVTDMAATIAIGKISPTEKKLIKVTKEALDLAIKKIKPNIHLGDISFTIQNFVEKNGFNVIRDLVGHGVGEKLHEEPQIPNYGNPGTGPILKPGMTLAIEPMVTIGDYFVALDQNKQTFKTADDSPCAHFEHTVLVTEKGSEILTKI